MGGSVDSDQRQQLEVFLNSLRDVPWFAPAGDPSPTHHVAEDAVVAWDDWTNEMMAVWPVRSERLETAARDAIGDPAIDDVFNRVADALEPQVRSGVKAYFARRPNTTQNTNCDADRGLWREILERVLRDLSWAAIETILDRPEFYCSLIAVYREGRWPCAWKGRYPVGQFVVL